MANSGRKWVILVFMGEYEHNIDTKGRIIVPVKFREELGPVLIATRWMDGCIALFTLEKWQEIYENLRRLPSTKKEARMYTHMIMSKAAECEVDNMGRIRLPKHLMQEGNLVKECSVVGVSDHVEIWNRETWNSYYDSASENFETIAESLTEYF